MKRRFLAWLLCAVMLFNNALPVFATETTEPHEHEESATLCETCNEDPCICEDTTEPATDAPVICAECGKVEAECICCDECGKAACECIFCEICEKLEAECTCPELCPDCGEAKHGGECQPAELVCPGDDTCTIENCPNHQTIENKCPTCDAIADESGVITHALTCADVYCHICGNAKHDGECCAECKHIDGHADDCPNKPVETCEFCGVNMFGENIEHAISCHTHCGDGEHLITCSLFEGPECCKWTIENGELKHAENCITNCTCEMAECPLHPKCEECGAKYENGKYTHTVECSHYMCPNCNGKKDENGVLGHAEKCSEYVCPLCNEKGKHAITCEKYVPVIMSLDSPYVGEKGIIKSGKTIYTNYINGEAHILKPIWYIIGTIREYSVTIEDHFTVDGIEWVEFKFDSWLVNHISGFNNYKYAHFNDVNFDFNVVKDEESGVSVQGGLPEGASLVVTNPDEETATMLLDNLIPDFGESFSQVGFFDISINKDGSKVQPDGIVTVKLEDLEIAPDMNINIYHILDDEEAIESARENGILKSFENESGETVYYTILSSENGEVIVNEDGTLTFATDSFSIYVVEAYDDTITGKLISNGVAPNINCGETKYYKWYPPDGTADTVNGTWSVEKGSDLIDYAVLNSIMDENVYSYWWIKVTAKAPGEVKLKYTYISEKTKVSEYITITVNPYDTGMVYIEDKIAEYGCLIPRIKDTNLNNVYFEWSRSDSADIEPNALILPYIPVENGMPINGAINIAIDRGGIDAPSNMNTTPEIKTYTVKAFNEKDELIGSATYSVNYGNEVLNGSFELPGISAPHYGYAYPNGTENMFWKSTISAADGSVDDGNMQVTKDIEVLSVSSVKTAPNSLLAGFGLSKLKTGVEYKNTTKYTDEHVEPDDKLVDGGSQFAEINAEAGGALYQDVLTYPGAELYWSVAHRARNVNSDERGYWAPDGHKIDVINKNESSESYGKTTHLEDMKDYMYVIIAPTNQVRNIKTQNDLNGLIDNVIANEVLTPNASFPDGSYSYNGIDYSIWRLATDHTAWKVYDNNDSPYIVSEGQYLTRYFFASGSTIRDRILLAQGNQALYANGNLIDAISFSDDMPWRIEYYLDGDLQEDLTQSGKAVPNSYDGASDREAKHLSDSRFANATLTETTINDRDFNKQEQIDLVYTEHNVLKIYYKTSGISISKKIEISNMNSLAEEEVDKLKMMLSGYSVEFDLLDENDIKVANAVVNINPETLTGTAEFKNNGIKFIPDAGGSYKIVELDLPSVDSDLILRNKADDYNFILPEGIILHTHEATNVYEMVQYRDLTINKDYVYDTYKTLDPDQTFIFNIKGNDDITEHIDMTVMIPEDGEVTIKNLPVGNYNITEDENWSWRYSVSDVKDDYNSKITGSDGVYPVSLTVNNNTVTFTNIRDKFLWMDGNTWCQNVWKPDNSGIDAIYGN